MLAPSVLTTILYSVSRQPQRQGPSSLPLPSKWTKSGFWETDPRKAVSFGSLSRNAVFRPQPLNRSESIGDLRFVAGIQYGDTVQIVGYTFGDNQEASRRLRRLAEVYEPETRDLLNSVRSKNGDRRFELALDLGCGPGWSTQLIEATLSPKRIIGMEASETYVAEARRN